VYLEHHVAPVAGAVADRDEQRHVPALGLGKRLLSPLPPVHRVVRVLEEVWRRRAGKPVHKFTLSCRLTGQAVLIHRPIPMSW
jgi:hypothetical protein